MKLSKRLQAIADLIIKYKHGNILADIGTDHAYLPCYLVKNKILSRAYACDIAEGPLCSSLETIQQHHLQEDVIPLLGSGLNPILDRSVDMVSICGMGGKLMVDILDEHRDFVQPRFFLQANVGVEVLREYLYRRHMEIIDEDIVQDARHIYEIIVCQKAASMITGDERDIFFGPCLRQKKPPLFYKKWARQLETYRTILTSLEKDNPRYQEVCHMITLIEGEINESKTYY